MIIYMNIERISKLLSIYDFKMKGKIGLDINIMLKNTYIL